MGLQFYVSFYKTWYKLKSSTMPKTSRVYMKSSMLYEFDLPSAFEIWDFIEGKPNKKIE